MDVQESASLISKFIAHPLFMKGVLAIVIISIIYILARLAQVGVSGRIEDKDLRYKVRKSISFVGYLFAFIVVLSIFGAQMTNLTLVIGALSVGIGFGMRELIQSLIGWASASFWGLYKP